jgi:hypothetical protein
VFNAARELLRYLKQLEPAAAEQEAFHVALNPTPPRAVCVLIRELIEDLEKVTKPPGR